MSESNGNGRHDPASFLSDRDTRDPALDVPGMPPNYGQFALPHVLTYQGFFGTASKVYRANDEALRHSRENSRFMRNDCGVMECVEARQRAVALLDWDIVPEDDESPEQQALCEELKKVLQRIRRFTEFRRSLLEAIWFGRSAIQCRYGWEFIRGKKRCLPMPEELAEHPGWLPIHGDKLVFRYDDGYGSTDNLPPGSVGVLAGARFKGDDKIRGAWELHPTGQGLAAFVPPSLRSLLVIHKHMIEDGAWDDPQSAGSIHGLGIRSRIYWDWVQKQESLAFLIEYLERSAGGIEVWEYPAGSPGALEKTQEAAKNRVGNGKNVVFFPKPMGPDADLYDLRIIEPGMAGVEQLKSLLTEYFGHRIKRYILGQTLSTEAAATGLGSGVAELHLDSFLQIVKYDATNLEETISEELLLPIQRFNFPTARFRTFFRINTEDSNIAEKLDALQRVWEMGAALPTEDVMDMIGMRIPADGEAQLKRPDDGGMGGMMPGPEGYAAPKSAMAATMDRLFAGRAREGTAVLYQRGKWIPVRLSSLSP